MLKNNKKQLALTSFVILLPAIVGLLLWNRLPALLPTHYALTGEADTFGAKAIAVFVIPLLTLFTHWLCVLLTATDRKNAGRNDKMFRVMLWICPLVSIFDSALLFAIPTGNTASGAFAAGASVRRDRKLSSQMHAEHDAWHQAPLDAWQRRELERDAPLCREGLGLLRACDRAVCGASGEVRFSDGWRDFCRSDRP